MDPVAGVSYSLNKQNHTAVKMDLKTSVMLNGATIVLDGSSNTMRDDLKDKIAAEIKMKVISDEGVNKGVVQRTPSTERIEESLGAQTMEGLVAVGKRTTITVPVNPEIGNDQPIKVVDEQWYSPRSTNQHREHTDDTAPHHTNHRALHKYQARLNQIRRSFKYPPTSRWLLKKRNSKVSEIPRTPAGELRSAGVRSNDLFHLRER